MEQSIEKISINFYDHHGDLERATNYEFSRESWHKSSQILRQDFCNEVRSQKDLKCAEHQLGGIWQQVCKSQMEQRYRPDNHISAKISIFKIRKSLQNNNAFINKKLLCDIPTVSAFLSQCGHI